MSDARFADKSALIVGLGGLGCPAALALARAGVGTLLLCDDDIVEETNLHRQILFNQGDVGRDKLDAAKDALESEGVKLELIRSRFLPDNSRDLVRRVDVVLEGADNFATKFLAADACFLEGKPIVHGACVRFVGTAWSVSAVGRPCYRCLFEDLLPDDEAPNCTGAGVFGPVVGIVGAFMADLALDTLQDDSSRNGQIFCLDGRTQNLRVTSVAPRANCPLCADDERAPKITQVSRNLYTGGGSLESRLHSSSNSLNA